MIGKFMKILDSKGKRKQKEKEKVRGGYNGLNFLTKICGEGWNRHGAGEKKK